MCALPFFHFGKKATERSSSVCGCHCNTPYVILDVETTGLNPGNDKIIQLSAIRYDCSGRPLGFFNTYVNPGIHIPTSASKINGITDALLQSAPSIDDVREDFLRFVGDELIIGYNITFDLRFLNCEFLGAFEGRIYIDALQIARSFFNSPDYRLETVSSSIGFIPSGNYHDSFIDCEAVAAILSSIGEIDIDDFSHKFSCSSSTHSRIRQHRHNPSVRDITPASTFDCNPDHPLYGKNIVFTGELHVDRKTAWQLAANVGGIVKSSVSKKTHFLVVGHQDTNLVGDDGMSTKEETAYALNASGTAQIQIIGEDKFFELLTWSPAMTNEETINPCQGDIAEMDEQMEFSGFSSSEQSELDFLNGIRTRLESSIQDNGGDCRFLSIKTTKQTKSQSSGYTAVKLGNFTSFRLRLRGKQQYISLPTVFVDLIPNNYPTKFMHTDPKYCRILIDTDHPIESYTDFLIRVAGETVNRYPKEWDCCSRYMECSDAKCCVHPDKSFALGCGYRRILSSGRVFYGKNRNI